jgi:carbohydrate kinase (thermoresistant glucokinase family)
MRIVVMGVSGCGKSRVGQLLAEAIGARFTDGDDLHSVEAKAKMNAGTPLNDEDRWPWLDRVAATLNALGDGSAVVACSALKKVYRDRIRAGASEVFFVHLDGSRELLAERIGSRSGHFFPAHMLDSQLAILERLEDDELGVTLDVASSPEELVAQVLESIRGALS